MLSLPHLVVLFVMALIIFGPQKLPELARMLGKATAEFRKMTNDFRYALEDEVRELERQTRIREEEIAAAARAAQTPVPAPSPAPEGAVPRESRLLAEPAPAEPLLPSRRTKRALRRTPIPTRPSRLRRKPVSVPHEKSSDDNTAV